jgi:hypothetical protein
VVLSQDAEVKDEDWIVMVDGNKAVISALVHIDHVFAKGLDHSVAGSFAALRELRMSVSLEASSCLPLVRT